MSVLNLSRRPDGAQVWDSGWQFFREQWEAADDEHRVEMEDGRPAVRRDPVTRHELPSYVAPSWGVWRFVQQVVDQELMHQPPSSRERLCRMCLHKLELKQELVGDWVFTCPQCHNAEVLSKKLVGGTIGQGEKEKT